MPAVVHFEIPADDLDRAKTFYSSIFEWEIVSTPMPEGEYTGVVTTPVDPQTQLPVEPGGINGALVPRQAEMPAPVVTIDVEAIDAALAKVEAGGGSVIVPRTPIPGMGAFAYFRDPEDNVVGLWENPSA